MATTVVSLPLPQSLDVESNPAEARKRRREILASHRHANGTSAAVTSTDVEATDDAASVTSTSVLDDNKRRRVSNDFPSAVASSGTSSAKVPVANAIVTTKVSSKPQKKPQLKYDPDVPMTKEEAAVWRREQRRKRNRESAAASRQRQRDRIVELEEEVEEWKVKFDEVMKRIQELEAGAAGTGTAVSATRPCSNPEEQYQQQEESTDNIESSQLEDQMSLVQSPEELVEEVFKDTTILVSPMHSPRSVSPAGSPVLDFSQVQAVKVLSGSKVTSSSEQDQVQVVFRHQEEQESQQPSKMISRPA